MHEAVEGYLNKSENHRIDFKRSDKLGDPTGVAKQLAAFANRNGGKIVFGITDSGNVEGAEITEDGHVQRISNIARDKCSPPVEISHEFYREQDDGSTIGDILVIDISSSVTTPVAVTDGPARTYYIRSANESRPITDPDELRWLFNTSRGTQITQRADIYLSLDGDLSLFLTEPYPPTYEAFKPFFGELSTKDKQTLLEDSENIERYITEILPYVFLSKIGSGMAGDFWLYPTEEKYSNEIIMNVILDEAEELLFEDWSMSLESVFKTDTGDDGVDQRTQDAISSQLTVSPEEILRENGNIDWILVPPETELTIEYLNQNISRIAIEKEGAFEISIDSSRISGNLSVGMPEDHPLSIDDVDANNLTSHRGSLHVSCDFEFPDFSDSNITRHTAFGQGVADIVYQEWDYNHYLEENLGQLVKLNNKLERIENKLDSHIGSNG